jgi:hypothetical protein
MMECSYRFQSFVDYTWVLKVIVRKVVELVEEISNIDATEWIHLRKGKHAREANVRLAMEAAGNVHDIRKMFPILLGLIPADVDHFIIFIKVIDRHWHIIIRRDNLPMLAADSLGNESVTS